LPNTTFVYGNGETRLIKGGVPPPTIAEAQQRPDLIPLLVEIRATLAWSVGILVITPWFDWIANLPVEQRLTLPDGTKLLMVHASPGRETGLGFHPLQPDEVLRELAGDCSDDVLVVGHMHIPTERHVGRHHWVNPGSVGQPMSGDPRACYAILEADSKGYCFTFYRVDYDREAVIKLARARQYPAVEDMIKYFNGVYKPDEPYY